MKKDTHPTYYKDATITCACGNTLTIGSTVKDISVEICGACHPFYTGKQKFIDTAGRVEKFQRRASKKEVTAAIRKGKKNVKTRIKKTEQ